MIDARALPMGDGKLRAIVIADVLHHVGDVAAFLREAERVPLPFMPLRYLVSGGVSLRSLQPAWTAAAWRALERVPLARPARDVRPDRGGRR